MKEIRVLFTGGGTGGHIYPLVAVLEELYNVAARHQFEFTAWYLGPASPYDKNLREKGVNMNRIPSSKFRRYFSLENFLDLPKFFYGLFQALFKVFVIMPDAVFSKGGPGALAVILAARFYRIPVIIHESDAVPGLTNRLCARFAERIGLSFASAAEQFSSYKNKLALVGNPIRPSLSKGLLDQEGAKRHLGFVDKIPVILILGGSQGSVRINEFILDNLTQILSKAQVIHQAGGFSHKETKKETDMMLKDFSDLDKRRYRLMDFLEEKALKDSLTAADLVISRAGAGAIFEIAAFGKPSILIPLEESANNHQKINAYEYSRTGAAIIIEEPNLLNSIFLNQLEILLGSPDKLKTMSDAARSFAKPDAGRIIAEEIVKLAGRG